MPLKSLQVLVISLASSIDNWTALDPSGFCTLDSSGFCTVDIAHLDPSRCCTPLDHCVPKICVLDE